MELKRIARIAAMKADREATAQILRFPLERRLKGRTAEDTVAEEPRVAWDSWYHDAAIREDRKAKS